MTWVNTNNWLSQSANGYPVVSDNDIYYIQLPNKPSPQQIGQSDTEPTQVDIPAGISGNVTVIWGDTKSTSGLIYTCIVNVP